MKVTVCRKAHFNAAHRLYNKSWTNEQNESFYGKCNNPSFHGHNYEIVVKVHGNVSLETGYVVDMKWLSDLIDEEIAERFDHKNLNLDTEEFRELIPTAENIAIVCWNILRPHIDKDKDLTVVIHETSRNFVEYRGE